MKRDYVPTSPAKTPENGAVECRFLVPGASYHSAAAQVVRDDACTAQLSRLFRGYYRVRCLLPVRLRRLLQKIRRVEVGDGWYFPERLSESLCEAIRRESAGTPVIHPWPDGARFAVVLTHDVDTQAGFDYIGPVAEIEEELGFRSSWNLVPSRYRIDERVVEDLVGRSFEIGVHGYNHDGRLYSSRREFDRRAGAINAALAKYHAVGFRSPMVHRHLDWLQSLDVEYDSSCFDVDPFQAMPGGVGTIWPFIAGRFVELPYTLPQDHTVFVVLGERDARIWHEKRDLLIRRQGMVLMLTHPDYLTTPARLRAYRELLATTKEIGGYWHALPREVADWWRQREQSSVARRADGEWTIEGPASDRARLATIALDDGHVCVEEISRDEAAQR